MDERRDDWRHGVDENLAGLNAGQRTQDSKLESLQNGQGELDSIIHGETDSGLIGRIEDLEADVSRLNAVIFQDAAGKKGLHHDIQMLLAGREDSRDRRGNWTKIAVAIITSGALGLFWHDIRAYFVKAQKPEMVERTKHSHKKHYIPETAPEPEPDEDQQ